MLVAIRAGKKGRRNKSEFFETKKNPFFFERTSKIGGKELKELLWALSRSVDYGKKHNACSSCNVQNFYRLVNSICVGVLPLVSFLYVVDFVDSDVVGTVI